MKHTKGKWCLSGIAHDEEDFEIHNNKELDVWVATVKGCQTQDSEETKANARLIAAAPELLEITTELIRQFGGVSSITPKQKSAIALAKEIYKKATGEKEAVS